MKGLHIVSTGRYLPKMVVSNEKVGENAGIDDEWIVKRTGIHERRFCDDETNTFMAVEAAKKAIEKGGIDKSEIGICMVATFSPDNFTPSTACMVQKELGLSEDIPSFDINAACSGFIYALHVAKCLLENSKKKYALVIGSEVVSRLVDFTDRQTAMLFGDGAGAALIELSDKHNFYSKLFSRGNIEELCCPAFGDQKVRMNGKEVFKFATEMLPKTVCEIMEECNLEKSDIDYYVCHQANKRIIDNAAKKIADDEEKFYINIDKYGNTSAASIPIVLDEMFEKELIKEGTRIICVGFGAGFTWGGLLLEF